MRRPKTKTLRHKFIVALVQLRRLSDNELYTCIFIYSLSAGVQFSFGTVSPVSPSDGSEATAEQAVLDLAVPVVITIEPSNSFLQSDTIVTVSVSSGNATGRFIILVTYMHLHHVYSPLYFFHLQRVKTLLCCEMK